MSRAALGPAALSLAAKLRSDLPGLAAEMAARVRTQETTYARLLGGDDVSVEQHCADNLRFVLDELVGVGPADMSAARATGRQRAEEGVPIEALLAAFRIGSRFLWEVMVSRADDEGRSELLATAADIWAVSDRLAVEVTDSYRSTVAARAQIDRQVRDAVLASLLHGATESPRIGDSADLLRLPQQGFFVVVAGECPSPGHEALPGVQSALREAGAASAWRLEGGMQEGVVAARSSPGVGEVNALLAQHVVGRVGVSRVYRRLDGTSVALREARLACQTVTPGALEVVGFEQRPLAVLAVSAPESAETLARVVLGAVLDLPAGERDPLLETVRVWLAANGSTGEAAGALHLHRNGVRYRLNRFEQLTGRRLANPGHLADVQVALEATRVLGLDASTPVDVG